MLRRGPIDYKARGGEWRTQSVNPSFYKSPDVLSSTNKLEMWTQSVCSSL